MTGVEIILILAGLVMMIGSFMVTEKLSGAELDRIAELSQNEIKKNTGKQIERCRSCDRRPD